MAGAQYTTVRPYRAHLYGLDLDVQGLAYQQQDGGAAVCASTALWSALQQVARIAGYRTPTPSEITAASGSPFAASYGLDDRQMASALANLGYAADHFVPAENRPLFRGKLVAALESRLPVILLLSRDETTGAGTVRVGHAVAVTGFAIEPGAEAVDVPAARPSSPSLPMIAASVRTLYVHDDNLGSHAHYELFDWDDVKSASGDPALGLLRGRSDRPPPEWWTADEWIIEGALVPKPPKLRMPLDNLFDLMWSFACQVFPVVLPIEFDYGVRVTTGVEYRAALGERGLDPMQMRRFQEALSLPRYIGVVRAHWKDALVCEFIADVTAVDFVGDGRSLLGVVAPGVALHSAAWKALDQLCGTIAIPLITAPPT